MAPPDQPDGSSLSALSPSAAPLPRTAHPMPAHQSVPASTEGDRHCLAHARCPVLAVPPPDLAQHAGHGLRGWAFRHRGLDPGQATLPIQTP
jgi:hypothetical protein